jgi:hypothetical protein
MFVNKGYILRRIALELKLKHCTITSTLQKYLRDGEIYHPRNPTDFYALQLKQNEALIKV